MDLKYSFKMSILSEEDGGGYLIEVPDLPGCMADGETPEEAIEKINDAIESWILTAKQIGKPIPKPKFYNTSDENEYSGKLTLRMPKQLHKDLTIAAIDQGVSINQLIIYFLSMGLGKETSKKQLKKESDIDNLEPYFIELKKALAKNENISKWSTNESFYNIINDFASDKDLFQSKNNSTFERRFAINGQRD